MQRGVYIPTPYAPAIRTTSTTPCIAPILIDTPTYRT